MGGGASRQQTITTVAAAIQLTANQATIAVVIQPAASNTDTIYIGGSDVTTGNGFELTGPLGIDANLACGEWYAVADAGTPVLEILAGLEVGGQ